MKLKKQHIILHETTLISWVLGPPLWCALLLSYNLAICISICMVMFNSPLMGIASTNKSPECYLYLFSYPFSVSNSFVCSLDWATRRWPPRLSGYVLERTCPKTNSQSDLSHNNNLALSISILLSIQTTDSKQFSIRNASKMELFRSSYNGFR